MSISKLVKNVRLFKVSLKIPVMLHHTPSTESHRLQPSNLMFTAYRNDVTS